MEEEEFAMGREMAGVVIAVEELLCKEEVWEDVGITGAELEEEIFIEDGLTRDWCIPEGN